MSLIEKLQTDKTFLFVGQNYFNGNNPIIKRLTNEFCTNYGNRIITDQNFGASADIFFHVPQNRIPFVTNVIESTAAPSGLQYVCSLPWNGVITSSVDGIVDRCLRSGWRTICEGRIPSNGRNERLSDRKNLTVTHLFGTVGEYSLPDMDIPHDKLNYQKMSRGKAVNYLRQYSSEVISAKGVLVITDYDPFDDWLPFSALVDYLMGNDFTPGQVHYFGSHISKDMVNLPSNISSQDMEDWELLLQEQLVTCYEMSFDEYLSQAEANGELSIEQQLADWDRHVRVTIAKRSLGISPSEYAKISKSAVLLDDSIYIDEEPLDDPLSTFEDFLSKSSDVPVWSGYRQGFYIKRDKEAELNAILEKEITDSPVSGHGKAILLEGQSGAGKTVLLGKIAYDLKMKKENPVLFIPQSFGDVDRQVIRDFCEWSERNGAKRIYIIWDASFFDADVNKYSQLYNFLRSLARNIVLIGSSYIVSEKNSKEYNCLKINIELSRKECRYVLDILKHCNISLTEDQIRENSGDSFFVMCYWFLRATRYALRKGVIQEAEHNKEMLAKVIEKNTMRNYPFKQLFMDLCITLNDGVEDDEYFIHDYSKLLFLICVVSQYGIILPLRLLLRIFGVGNGFIVAKLAKSVDLIRLCENRYGEWDVKIRTPLEASIILSSKLANDKEQFELLKEIITSVCVEADGADDYFETDFLIRLLHAIGPHGMQSNTTKSFYNEIANILLSKYNMGEYNWRTVVQMSLFCRHVVRNNSVPYNTRITILMSSLNALRDEIKWLNKRGDRNIYELATCLGYLYNEKAALLGTLLYVRYHDEEKHNVEELMKYYSEAWEDIEKSVRLIPESFHSLDVASWMTRDLIEANILEKYEAQERYASILSLFDEALLYNPDLYNTVAYVQRLEELSLSCGDTEVSDKAFERLLEMKSGAAVYIIARKTASDVPFDTEVTDEDKLLVERKCKEIIEYIDSYNEVTCSDLRCRLLRFKLLWYLYNGRPLFYKQHQITNLTINQWKEILESINVILTLDKEGQTTINDLKTNTSHRRIVLRYIRSVALFELGFYKEFKEEIRVIRNMPYPFGRRVFVNYLSCVEGKARVFEGVIESFVNPTRTMIYIPEIGMSIPYIKSGFQNQHRKINEKVTGMKIGFNFMGAIVCGME